MPSNDTVTIPVWLYERMAETYYGQKYGIDVPSNARLQDAPPPRIPEPEAPREHNPTYMDHLKDVEAISNKVPAGFRPMGAAARKIKKDQAPEASPPTISS